MAGEAENGDQVEPGRDESRRPERRGTPGRLDGSNRSGTGARGGGYRGTDGAERGASRGERGPRRESDRRDGSRGSAASGGQHRYGDRQDRGSGQNRGSSQDRRYGQDRDRRASGPRSSAPGVQRPLPRGDSRPPQADRPDDPWLDDNVTFDQLDRQARQRLRTLSKDSATRVGRHLVMAGLLVEDDAELAYRHAHAAMRRAGRVDVVREAVALTAYATGRYAEALREIRTVRRLSGVDALRAIEADCERGLGRPERALDLAAAPPSKDMSAQDRVELAIVASGARLDLEQPEAALLVLEEPTVAESPDLEMRTRVAHARIPVLRTLGRAAEAEALEADYPEPPAEDEDVLIAELPIPAVEVAQAPTGDGRQYRTGADRPSGAARTSGSVHD